jgi:hypothetical protein
MSELALGRLDRIIDSLTNVPDRECPIGYWFSSKERCLLRECAARFPATTSELSQAMRELADVYDSPILDCGLPQEDEVVLALIRALQSHKVLP